MHPQKNDSNKHVFNSRGFKLESLDPNGFADVLRV